MQSLDDDERKAVLGEALADGLRAITEYVKDVPSIKNELRGLKDELSGLKADVKVIKAAVTDMSNQQKGQEHRISRLEAA